MKATVAEIGSLAEEVTLLVPKKSAIVTLLWDERLLTVFLQLLPELRLNCVAALGLLWNLSPPALRYDGSLAM